jgi:hypothetical protein
MLKTEVIKKFLDAKANSDLAALYTPEMECQVNVGQDGGERINDEYKGKRWVGWENPVSGEVWKPFRIPWNAKTEPKYEDSHLMYNSDHFEAIGMTGWNWKQRVSKWVGYDFDAIIGHSEKHERKLTDRELIDLEDAIRSIPWVTLRYSTSGKGRHIYVFVNVPTNNHDEHAALARAILGMMSGITGFDFESKVDVAGGNLWVWHRRMTGDGLKLIKQGSVLEDIPPHWKEHLAVIRNKRSRTVPKFIENQNSDTAASFEDLMNQRSIVALDDEHKRLMNWLTENNYYCEWSGDNRMLITHTYYLKLAHEELSLRGIFDTIAEGSEGRSDKNCFAFAGKKGSWTVRRYSKGVAEASCWTQDAAGWTKTNLNQAPDFDTACRHNGGIALEKGGYTFNEAEMAVKAAKDLGIFIEAPYGMNIRKTILRKSKDGNLVLSMPHEAHDDASRMKGWYLDKKEWKRVQPAHLNHYAAEPETQSYDDVVRNLVNEDGVFIGWYIKTETGRWTRQPIDNVRPALISCGIDPADLPNVLGSGVMRHWTVVNRPFQQEYLPNRQWNKNGAQIMFQPSLSENRSFPTWQKILNHLGKGLDASVKQHAWCKDNAITSGADYLKVWIAALFQKPLSPAPYLFLYSEEQNTGKSVFYESLQLLISPKSVVEGKLALESKSDFSGELANAVLCFVNEVNLSKGLDKGNTAYNKIKNWVTGLTITIHPKGKDAYQIPNAIHWVQTGNSPDYCPMFPGDTRITMIHVEPIPPEQIIPKAQLLKLLETEAPDFMAEILSLEIPDSHDRLVLPVVDTEEKRIAEIANTSPLHLFCKEQCHYVPGEMILLAEFTEKFHTWLLTHDHDSSEVDLWTTRRVAKELPAPFAKGYSRRFQNKTYVINCSYTPINPNQPQKKRLGIDPNGNICEEGDSV